MRVQRSPAHVPLHGPWRHRLTLRGIFQAVAHLSSSAAKPVEIKVKIHLTQNKN